MSAEDRLAEAVAILRDILAGWPNDDERFDRGLANARAFLAAQAAVNIGDAGAHDVPSTEAGQ